MDELPRDDAVPALRAIAREGAEPVLRRAGLEPPFDELALLRHHEGRRCTFALRAGGRAVVAKAYRREVGGQARLLAELARHGLACGRPPTAPPLVAANAELRLLVCGRLDGPAGPALLERGARVGALAAEWLRAQWAAGIDLGAPFGPEAFLDRVRRGAAAVAAAAPELRERTGALVAALADARPVTGAPVLAHGSFSFMHVIDLGDGPGVVDWDGFCQAPRELDAGTFLATLAREATAGAAVEARAAEAERALRAGLGPAVDPAALCWYEAGARLRNARHLCARRPPGWRSRSARLLNGARALLDAPSPPRGPAPRDAP
jgi:hypothetical protein